MDTTHKIHTVFTFFLLEEREQKVSPNPTISLVIKLWSDQHRRGDYTHTHTISILTINEVLLNASMLYLYVLNFALLALELIYFILT